MDSVHSHANWAQSLGGISFPLLADFHPKGAVAAGLGLYLAEKGITDRATVIIDADGAVRFIEAVGPGGQRDIEVLAAKAEEIDAAYGKELPARAAAPGLAEGASLFVKDNCGVSRAVLLARANLHLADTLPVANVSQDADAMGRLRKSSGDDTVPCMMLDGKPVSDTPAIIAAMVAASAPL